MLAQLRQVQRRTSRGSLPTMVTMSASCIDAMPSMPDAFNALVQVDAHAQHLIQRVAHEHVGVGVLASR